uniref:hypothetical protein n=1 Tax=uncultured Caulobacter sp. TaxID=158749 RepID=UPI0025D55761|nr:hypothetical protein [uncultured Caulobacter sp.]
MGFLTEMLAVAIVWLSSFALCQFGVAVEQACPHAKSQTQHKTVARSPRDLIKPMPIAVSAPAAASREA